MEIILSLPTPQQVALSLHKITPGGDGGGREGLPRAVLPRGRLPSAQPALLLGFLQTPSSKQRPPPAAWRVLQPPIFLQGKRNWVLVLNTWRGGFLQEQLRRVALAHPRCRAGGFPLRAGHWLRENRAQAPGTPAGWPLELGPQPSSKNREREWEGGVGGGVRNFACGCPGSVQH